jgi:hypothetical protein
MLAKTYEKLDEAHRKAEYRNYKHGYLDWVGSHSDVTLAMKQLPRPK